MELDSVLLRGMLAVPVGWQFWLGWMALLNLVVAAFYSAILPLATAIKNYAISHWNIVCQRSR